MDKFHTQSGGLHVKEGHEGSDFSIRGIVVFAVLLALGLVVTFILAGVLMRVFEWGSQKYIDAGMTPVQEQLQKQRGAAAEPQTNQYPGEKPGQLKPSSETEMRARIERSNERTFAQPRLQYDDVDEMNRFRKAQNDYLNATGKDEQGGLHIPIDRAMNVLSQRGLPAVNGKWSPQAPVAVPTGESRGSEHQFKDNRGLNKGVTR